MGVHDYICFIGRNNQNLVELNQESNSAIIVIIPDTFNVENILSWKLTKFSTFPYIEYEYSWDEWDFPDLPGYQHYLDKEYWWKQSIWKHSDYPNKLLVNFEPDAFKLFVLGHIDYNTIADEYYEELLGNRGLDMPNTKEIAYNHIVDCGQENIAEYNNIRLPELLPPIEYISILDVILESDIFNKVHSYRLTTNISNIHPARLAILIKDNIKSTNTLLLPICYQINFSESSFRTDDGKYLFKFTPKISPYIDDELLNGCFECGKSRLRTKYLCLDHQNANIDIAGQQTKINTISHIMMDYLALLTTIFIPSKLYASFYEHEYYNLELELA